MTKPGICAGHESKASKANSSQGQNKCTGSYNPVPSPSAAASSLHGRYSFKTDTPAWACEQMMV